MQSLIKNRVGSKPWALAVVGALTLTAGQVATAAPVIDGSFSLAEWGSPVKTYVQVSNTVDTYFAFDATNVYGAIVESAGSDQSFANIYLYSSTNSTHLDTSAAGSYGDGNDIVIETTNRWGFANPAGIMAGTEQYFTNNGDGTYSVGGVTVGRVGTNNVVEFSIDRDLLDNYDSLRYGGQLFAYEFHRGTNDPEPGAMVLLPEPASLAFLGLGGIALLRRRPVA